MPDAAQPDGAYDVFVERDVMVTMRDGVRLATDVYRPALNGAAVAEQLPVILERTPYGKTQRSRSEVDAGMSDPRPRPEIAEWFVRHGYVVVYQDCRGRHGSEGEFVKYLRRGLLRAVLRRAADPYVELVRRLRAHRDRQLCCAVAPQARPGAAHAWTPISLPS